MGRGGRVKDREASERRCLVTGARGAKSGLIRFVVDPDGRVVPDLVEKLPGRGMWVSAERAAVEKAARKGLFSRAAKRAVTAEPALAERVTALLAARVVELVSLARRAGQAVAGFEKTKALLESGAACCLLQAADGSPRERARLRPPEGEDTLVRDLTASELGLAFGRDRVIHAALVSGGLGERVRYESARLSGMKRNPG